MSLQSKTISRQSVIAVLGHVDHGKSSLLDFIRKSNIVSGEAGGITQRIAAYEVTVKNETGNKKITFLDTPGHAAFSSMRERGVLIADIAILIVSAEDGVKTQTLDAWKTINARKLPVIVAINKIDKPGADVQKTKNSLIENGIYVEGMGGDIPCVLISAKTGEGVPFLLETIAIMSDMLEISSSESDEATGFVLESFVDSKRGVSATLVIKDGFFPTSGSVLAGTAISPIRIVEDFAGKAIKGAVPGTPIVVTGFDIVPKAGTMFIASANKKAIEAMHDEAVSTEKKEILDPKIYRNARVVIPVVIKADALGTLDAIVSELKKRETKDVKIKIIGRSVGNVGEGDILMASHDADAVIIGFAVKEDGKARMQSERFGLTINIFDIIYKLTEWFDTVVEERLPFDEVETQTGALKIIKTFSVQKEIHVVGGLVTEGSLTVGSLVRIVRRGTVMGKGKITELQQSKIKTKEVLKDNECGVSIETKIEMIPSDIIEAYSIIKKKI